MIHYSWPGRYVLFIGILFLTAVNLFSWPRVCAAGAASAPLTLMGAGATFPYPIYAKWMQEYEHAHPSVRITYQSIGSGGGIKLLKAGTVDFGASDVPLSDADLSAMPAPVVQLPMVAGAIAVTYYLPGVATGLQLTPEVLAGIFLGEITSWTDARIVTLNPGTALPNLPITPMHRGDGSGETFIFTHYLSTVSPTWAEKVGSGKLVDWPVGMGFKGGIGPMAIRDKPGSIGYVPFAYVAQNRLPCAFIRNQAGKFVEPSVASATAAAAGALTGLRQDIRALIVNAPGADAYPIAGFTYILLDKAQPDAEKAKALVTFLNWAIHDGQQEAAKLLYAPLPVAVVHINENTLKSITVNGKSLLGK